MSSIWKYVSGSELAGAGQPPVVNFNNQSAPPHTKLKRSRTTFTRSQLVQLESEFKRSVYADRIRRIEIAQRLSLPERSVINWFQNRRMKHKNDLQGPQGATNAVKVAQPMRAQYSALPQPRKCCQNTAFVPFDIQESKVTQPPTPEPCKIIQVPVSQPPSLTLIVNENLNYLSDYSSSRDQDFLSYSLNNFTSNSLYNLDVDIQSINSQDPALQQPNKCSFAANDIQESEVIQPPTSQLCDPDKESSKDSRSSSEDSSSSSWNNTLLDYSYNLDIVCQFINQDLETSALAWLKNVEQCNINEPMWRTNGQSHEGESY